jgi:hypothetical protein
MFADIFGTPNQTVKEELICLADFFTEDFRGGAELTTEAILKASPFSVFKFKPSSKKTLQEQIEFVKANKDKIWLVGNFSSMHPKALEALKLQGTKYFIIEYDFKYCAFRSPQLHLIQQGKECDCHVQPIGQWMRAFYSGAKALFFMSEKQQEWYANRFPELKSQSLVQSSTWEPDHLDVLAHYSSTPKSEKWAILAGGSWIKGQEQTEKFAKDNNLEYELIGNLPYSQFIKELSLRKGLIFLPLGFDTCPRIVVEAQLMGLDLILNENVLHAGEAWTELKGTALVDELKKRPKSFWDTLRSRA